MGTGRRSATDWDAVGDTPASCQEREGRAPLPCACPEAQAPPKGTVEGDGPELRHGVRPVIPAGCWPRPSTWEEPGSWPRQLQVVQPEGAGMSPPRGWAENPGIATVPLPGHLRGLQVQEFSTKANTPPEPRCLFSRSLSAPRDPCRQAKLSAFRVADKEETSPFRWNTWGPRPIEGSGGRNAGLAVEGPQQSPSVTVTAATRGTGGSRVTWTLPERND